MIGGNIQGVIQVKASTQKNEYGESVAKWEDAKSLKGYLDLMSGTSSYTAYNSKIAESTHVFICDYQDLSTINVENSRMIINGKLYDVTYIDNPMELNKHLEIFLKHIGGVQVVN